MRVGAYQFPMTGSIARNLDHIREGVRQAAAQAADLLVFPECALTGYPPRHILSSEVVDWAALDDAHAELQELAVARRMHLIVGTMQREADAIYNSALLFSPDGQSHAYRKRALWGWDADNFRPGSLAGIWDIAGLRVGVRICYEVRFPEYFRELYKAKSDLNLLLFCDLADVDDPARYDLIRAHIRTRAVENVCPILAVNASSPFQTSPTGFYDASGQPLAELQPGREALLLLDWSSQPLNFGEQGRKTFSDQLVK